MINNRDSENHRKPLATTQSVVYDSSVWGWTYSHHPSITYFKGRYYAMWSNGKKNEDDIGQRVLMSVSEDGAHWSDPTALFPPVEGNSVLTSVGWYVREDGYLNAYAGLYFYPDAIRPKTDVAHSGTTLLCKTSADGEVWSEAIDLHLPIVANQPPRRLKSGRLLLCGNVTVPYTDDPTGLTGWKIAGISPCPLEWLQDDSEGFNKFFELRGDAYRLCEASFFQTEDEVIHVLMRNARPGTVENKSLYLCESFDNGEHYSEPQKLDFSDNNAKFYCMKLCNGAYAVVSNPDRTGNRCPLALLLSQDGENFSARYDIAADPIARKFEGIFKGGVYGYPNAVEAEGMLTVIVSINKEDVRVFRFAVPSP